MALWAMCLFVFPIQREMAESMTSLLSGLPAMILAGWAYQIHAILHLAGDQQFGINVSRINKMLLREHLLLVSGRVNSWY